MAGDKQSQDKGHGTGHSKAGWAGGYVVIYTWEAVNVMYSLPFIPAIPPSTCHSNTLTRHYREA
ncbi:hypothetical protein E2C01_068424 [Portunus trituberculatus]|uniref:Uncharacterized protein n=1 Tax=Portunus trituberculatus TaxID=210409 RepID=A0A5B7HWF0_PORTR|nr:hypothetical protein [Portunus trituberculatus]